MWFSAIVLVVMMWVGCGPGSPDDDNTPPATPGQMTPTPAGAPTSSPTPPAPTPPAEPTADESPTTPSPLGYANVIKVDITGGEMAYTFDVTVRSPDLGCQQYADWWEVLSLEGELLYRRVLDHSHVDEQPFTRSGGPVPIRSDESVIVRAHMNTSGYGGVSLSGTPDGGAFTPINLSSDFAQGVESLAPLPDGCAF